MVAKRGAEGYYALALMLEGRAVGVTVKVSDGDHADRARHFLVLEALNELGLPVEEMKELALYRERGIFNSNGTEVGRLERWKE
jgi:L-asparaginase II